MAALDELRQRLTAAGLGHSAEKIVRLVRPSYRLQRTLTPEEQISIGASKLGGSPDVPNGFEWPHVTNIKKPEAMEFVAQIRPSDLPEPVPEPAPRDGLLSFFRRWSEGRVFYFPEGTPLMRTAGPYAPVDPPPSGFWQNLRAGFTHKDPRHTYRAASLTFESWISPADGNSSMIQQLALSEADAEAYMELCEALWENGSPGDVVKHQMFGHASPVQNEMELECSFLRRREKPRWDLPPEDFVAAAQDWVLLLQLDSDDGPAGPGWMWGDLGIVYFWIHRKDLAVRTFAQAIAIEQCH
jgi:uncharacterized protein YwqG